MLMNVPPPMVSAAQRDNPRIFCAEDACGKQLPSNLSKNRRCPWCEEAGRIGLKRRYELGLTASLTMHSELELLKRSDRWSPEWIVIQLLLILAGAGDGIAVGMVSNGLFGAIVGVLISLIGVYGPSGSTSVEERRWVT